MTRTLRVIGWIIAWMIGLACVTWAFGAVSYDFPVWKNPAAFSFLLAVVAGIFLIRGHRKKILVPFAAFLLVLLWWLTLSPTNTAEWQPDVERTAWAEINGDTVTFHNVRNNEYRSETDFTPQWETRTVQLSQLTGIDMAINYWGSPWIAHPIVSFQFSEAPPVCFSIEIRKKVGQIYSAIGGLYRQYELIYIVADERDVIRVRTNYRKGEDIYLYHLTLTPAQARERFLEYVGALNELHERPRWYNAITTNCTTSIRAQHPFIERTPWDWRILLNGKGDEMMYENGVLSTGGLPFAELKKQSIINDLAMAANDAPDFSERIRQNLILQK